MAQVCRRFQKLADHPGHWKPLYREVFEYDLPLLHLAPCVFKFLELENCDRDNPWKDSFQQLYHGLHVRPGYEENAFPDRKIMYFDTVHDALSFSNYYMDKSDIHGHDVLIFVHGGTHRGEILIDSNVALLGASAGPLSSKTPKSVQGSVILVGENESTVKFAMGAEAAYIGFLTLFFQSQPIQNADISPCCLEITEKCSPTVHECIIRHHYGYGSAVRVSGYNAEPVMTDCYICKSLSGGLIVENGAQGTYDHNLITQSEKIGILVTSKANPVFCNNRVSNGKDVGITLSGGACGIFDGNEVVDNNAAAFEVTEEANPSVTKNELRSSEGMAAVHIHNGGMGTFSFNMVSASNAPGIICSNGRNPTIKGNFISDCVVGVHITGLRGGWIEDNNIHKSSFAGILIENSNPDIRENQIHEGDVGGIEIRHEGRGHIVLNNIYTNGIHGVRIESNSAPVLKRNNIYSGYIGVHFRNGAYGVLKRNAIANNNCYNVKIETGSSPLVRKNKIKNGSRGGVSISNGGLGVLVENVIYENSVAGVWIKNFSNPTLKANRILDTRGCGVHIVNYAKGMIERNHIHRSKESGVLISSQSNPTLRQNEIWYGLRAGIDITSDASATIENNTILYNRFSGINLATGVQAVIRGNIIQDNEDLVEKAGQACAFVPFHNTFTVPLIMMKPVATVILNANENLVKDMPVDRCNMLLFQAVK
ncbi:F-box only protein 11-like Protein [Gryllus bimaculatus]|nr:F-box only protein 11-like Protein [Gryllus bimaculatus]